MRDRLVVREFHDDDLDEVVGLWERASREGSTPVYSLSEVIASCQADHAVVALRGERTVGAAVGRPAHGQGWVVFFSVVDEEDPVAAAGHLFDALERSMAPRGLNKLSILLPQEHGLEMLTGNSFSVHPSVRYLERRMPVQRREVDLLKEVGGRILPRHLWRSVAGMAEEKALLEERLVVPLSHPELAGRFGVVPPRAVMLFGPPGTGKTTFARAVASRLDWPFVELFPSRLGEGEQGLASGLRSTFETISHLEHAVVFIDEVEEIAAQRGGRPPSPTQGVTNELLKLVGDFRDGEGRLLICATNFVRALDEAFLRHGRFDYVIPIGLPDTEARNAIWRRYVPQEAQAQIAVDELVAASDGLTPADIEYAARRAAQSALAQALTHEDDPTGETLSTEDYLTALRSTRATVSGQVVAEFTEDIETIARL